MHNPAHRNTATKRWKNRLAAALQALLILSATLPAAAQDDGAQYVIAEGTPLYEEIMPLALIWKHAMLAREYDTMFANYIPADVQITSKQLADTASPLYKMMYDTRYVRTMKLNGRSMSDILQKARRPKIVLVATYPAAQRGVNAYFYDEATHKLTFPMPQWKLNRLLLKDVAAVSFIRCAKKCKPTPDSKDWKIIFPHEPEPE